MDIPAGLSQLATYVDTPRGIASKPATWMEQLGPEDLQNLGRGLTNWVWISSGSKSSCIMPAVADLCIPALGSFRA